MKLAWRKPETPKIDRVLATNGAHKPTTQYNLVEPSGAIHARVQMINGEWRFWLPNSAASGPFLKPRDCKAAARRCAERLAK